MQSLNALLLACLSGIAFTASAAFSNCDVSINSLAAFDTSIHDVFIAPEEFNTLAPGEPVSLVRRVGTRMICTMSASTSQWGIGMLAVPGAKNVPNFSGMFTSPDLEALGLGYRVRWYTYTANSTTTSDTITSRQTLPDITKNTAPIHWLTPGQAARDAGLLHTTGEAEIQFFKIGNMVDTGGVRISATISAELVRFYLADSAAPGDTSRNVSFIWNSSTFVSKVRACTPAVLGSNPNFVNLGTIVPTGVPANGTVLSETPFSLTFNCPYMAFEGIGFTFQPVYGTESTTIMKLKSGAGMASGVGIRLQMDLTGSWAVVNYNQNNQIIAFNRPVWSLVSDEALTATRSHTVNFKAEVVRVDGAFSPGKMESALIIVMRYK